MNKRIRKKKAKQQLIAGYPGAAPCGEAAEEMQREASERRTRQAAYFLYQVYAEAVRRTPQYAGAVMQTVYTPLLSQNGGELKAKK